jgi:hypothetical protein
MGTAARFSTSTVIDSNGLVPWLAAAGPLAYSTGATSGFRRRISRILERARFFCIAASAMPPCSANCDFARRISPSRTGRPGDGTWLAETLAQRAGLELEAPGFAQNLWASAQQSYSLDPEIGAVKFGPRYARVRTPLNNLRITTFFAGESEVRIVDPSRILDVQAFGCEVKFIPPVEP